VPVKSHPGGGRRDEEEGGEGHGEDRSAGLGNVSQVLRSRRGDVMKKKARSGGKRRVKDLSDVYT
jgi:hypothetical protein